MYKRATHSNRQIDEVIIEIHATQVDKHGIEADGVLRHDDNGRSEAHFQQHFGGVLVRILYVSARRIRSLGGRFYDSFLRCLEVIQEFL